MKPLMNLGLAMMFALHLQPWQVPGEKQETGEQILETSRASFRIRYKTEPDTIPLNQPFSMEVWVTPQSNRQPDFELQVDARMPHHRHGMVREPQLERLGPGHFRITQMLFHMPGRWELYFDVSWNGITERAWTLVHLE